MSEPYRPNLKPTSAWRRTTGPREGGGRYHIVVSTLETSDIAEERAET